MGKLTGANPESRGSSAAMILAGQIIVGGVVSWTVTVKLHWLVLPAASVAVQVTGFVPSTNLEPLGGTQNAEAPGQLSANVILKVTIAPGGPAHSTAIFVEQ